MQGEPPQRFQPLGSVERIEDASDAHRKVIHLTPHGLDVPARSAAIFDDLRGRWAAAIGAARLADLEESLRGVTPGARLRVDSPGWFGL